MSEGVADSAVVHDKRALGYVAHLGKLPPQRIGEGQQRSSLDAARIWALQHLDLPISLHDLAGRAQVSVRTLTRRFTTETGVTPFQWLLQQRLLRARELLETTDLTVDHVARRSGLRSGESLRQHLNRHLGMTPAAYRAAFTQRPRMSTAQSA
ncbi:helix-turn-helix domain-containing protein [Kribbella voronezhensis]|uniref:helix-turn-helix domain-containing protein n=1 Tax=Kribbella voronezhensis TaxID=2512212 RepID=UPI00192D5B56|nr:helix-turn-helix domain-containing protein [Kribbella voronezhensis]